MGALIECQGSQPATSYEPMKTPTKAFLVRPDYFDVDRAINPHMLDESGRPNRVNRERACKQWEDLRLLYADLGIECQVFEAEKGLVDMVFCANQVLPYWDDETDHQAFVLSNMADWRRHQEVPSIRASLEKLGFDRFHSLTAEYGGMTFEGMGDALWVRGRRLLCGGYGPRTKRAVYGEIQRVTKTPIVTFELPSPKFYHLDTCLCILDDEHVLAARDGFTEDGWRLLHELFAHVLEVPLEEADAPGFACNANCPDGKTVIIQEGNSETERKLERSGFEVVPVDTSEFVKSGGSVFCMKMMLF